MINITAAGNRFTPQYLLEALIIPSKVIPNLFRNEIINTEDGNILTGRVVNDEDKRLRIRTRSFACRLTDIFLDAIENRIPLDRSEVPDALLSVLTKEEILDLIAYLRAGGNPDDKAFTLHQPGCSRASRRGQNQSANLRSGETNEPLRRWWATRRRC